MCRLLDIHVLKLKHISKSEVQGIKIKIPALKPVPQSLEGG